MKKEARVVARRVSKSLVITLPSNIREAAQIGEGELVKITVVHSGYLIIQKEG